MSKRRAILKRQAYGASENKQRSFNSQFSYLENEYCMMNAEPDSVMVTSVGNGKQEYCVQTQSKEERVKVFDTAANTAAKRKSGYRMGNKHWEDVFLLTWRS